MKAAKRREFKKRMIFWRRLIGNLTGEKNRKRGSLTLVGFVFGKKDLALLLGRSRWDGGDNQKWKKQKVFFFPGNGKTDGQKTKKKHPKGSLFPRKAAAKRRSITGVKKKNKKAGNI